MTAVNIPALARYRTPPLGDHVYTQAARDFAMIGEGLLLIHNAPLLAVPSPGNGGQNSYPVVLWNATLSRCRKRTRAACENERNRPALSALCLAAAMLYARLAACQLADTSPQGLCAITDGTGVVFAQTSHFTQGLRMTAARSLSVLAMAADGPWPLLIADPANARIH